MSTTYTISDLARELDITTRAIRFYERCGFSATGETVDVDSERNLRGIRMHHPLNTSS